MTAYIWGGFVSQQINGQLERPIRDSLSKYNGEKNSDTEAVDSMQTLVSVFSTLIIDLFSWFYFHSPLSLLLLCAFSLSYMVSLPLLPPILSSEDNNKNKNEVHRKLLHFTASWPTCTTFTSPVSVKRNCGKLITGLEEETNPVCTKLETLQHSRSTIFPLAQLLVVPLSLPVPLSLSLS